MNKPRGPGEAHSIEFEPAKGGIVSNTRMRYARGGTGGGGDYDHENEKAIHPTMKSAHAHLTKHFGHVFGHEPKTGHVDKPEE